MPLDDVAQRVTLALQAARSGSSDFDLNPEFAPPPTRKLRPAAVLVPLIEGPNGVEVILTKRSSRLKHHPGQIAFPGGKVDAGDPSPASAALREAWEEIGLPADAVRLVGELPPHETVTGYQMQPFVGIVKDPFETVPELGEVAEVFRVPYTHVTDPARFSVQDRIWQGKSRRFYTVPYGPYYIWGATARILRGFADALQ